MTAQPTLPETPEFDVRRAKAALFQWVRTPPGDFRSSR